jgi:hypothetical protein
MQCARASCGGAPSVARRRCFQIRIGEVVDAMGQQVHSSIISRMSSAALCRFVPLCAALCRFVPLCAALCRLVVLGTAHVSAYYLNSPLRPFAWECQTQDAPPLCLFRTLPYSEYLHAKSQAAPAGHSSVG